MAALASRAASNGVLMASRESARSSMPLRKIGHEIAQGTHRLERRRVVDRRAHAADRAVALQRQQAGVLRESEDAGLLALKGHRAVGGMRASIYNATPLEAVRALCDFMADFAKRHG